MSLKSFFGKIAGKKEPVEQPPEQKKEDVIQHEISFGKMETRIEQVSASSEIHIYVNDEKTNIHTLAAETRIGRDPSQADIIVSELIVSKLHCTIYSVEQDFFIRDEGSTNGIFINDEKVTEQQIHNHDVILLGKKGTVRLEFLKR